MENNKGILNCHSHPYIDDLRPSKSDLDLANKLNWQKEFTIIAPNMCKSIYNGIGIVNISNIDYSITNEEIEEITKLFGGSEYEK